MIRSFRHAATTACAVQCTTKVRTSLRSSMEGAHALGSLTAQLWSTPISGSSRQTTCPARSAMQQKSHAAISHTSSRAATSETTRCAHIMFMWRAKLPLRQATSHAYAAQVFETLVRFRTHDSPYSKASVSLRHQLLMSHNVAVHCLRGRTLVAFGGMAHAPASTDWQGNDLGIWRTSTPATAPPLLWSTPRLVLTGDPEQTGCVDAHDL